MPSEDEEEGGDGGYALVINGEALVHALKRKYEKTFLEIGCNCLVGIGIHFLMAFPSPLSVGYLLSGDAPTEGPGGGPGQAQHQSRDAGHRRRSE